LQIESSICMNKERVNEILELSIGLAKKKEFESYDVSGVKTPSSLIMARKIPIPIIRKVLVYGLQYIIRYYPGIVRFLSSKPKYIYPQGQAIFIRGQIELLKKNNQLGDIDLVKKIADWLIKNRSKGYDNFCWGQPFLWQSRKPFPPNLPRATVTSQVAWAFIDLYNYTSETEYLDVAISACNFFIEDLNHTPDADGDFCFSYTTIDNYHIHNASLLAAAVLMRVGTMISNEQFIEHAVRATNFSIKHQNSDGSWYYWAPPDKINYAIDNYHTGFNLESLQVIIKDHKNSDFEHAYKIGLEYYFNNLFDGVIPKCTHKSIYPIDIQGCAQSIITFALDVSGDEKFMKKAKEIVAYTNDTFFIEKKKHFAFRIYANSKTDKSYYFRWGDAWMIRALAIMSDK